MSETFAILAFREGKVRGISVMIDHQVFRDGIVEWALDPTVEMMIRVPLDIARKSYDADVDQVRLWLAESTP